MNKIEMQGPHRRSPWSGWCQLWHLKINALVLQVFSVFSLFFCISKYKTLSYILMCRDPFFSPLVKRVILGRSFSVFISLKIFKHERKIGHQIFSLHIPSYTLIVMVFLVGCRCSISLETLTGVTHMHN